MRAGVWSAGAVVIVLGLVGTSGCGDTSGESADTAVDSQADDEATGADTGPDARPDSGPDTGTDTSGESDTSGPDDTQVADTAPNNPTGGSLKIGMDPITVRSGEERQVCRTINVPGDVPLDVVRFESQMRGISHHFNLYKVIDGTRFDPVTEEESATRDCAPAAEQLRGDAAYIYGSATPDRVMETPPGVAFRLEPGQRLILEFHAINYTLDPIEADVEVTLWSKAEEVEVEHHADIMWFANWGFLLPPGEVTESTKRCSVPYDVEIFGLMSHFHELGTHFEVRAVTAGGTTLVYEDDDWAHPKYEAFDPPLTLRAGESLEWTCTWNNTRTDWVRPDKGSKDEMCMVFAAAYPRDGLAADPIQCNVVF
ncbi:MAG TPA: hypothetical protein PK095_22475 [Myxococcota bacterium]|nr:hypothetical protein [Myxococcota bacterium]